MCIQVAVNCPHKNKEIMSGHQKLCHPGPPRSLSHSPSCPIPAWKSLLFPKPQTLLFPKPQLGKAEFWFTKSEHCK